MKTMPFFCPGCGNTTNSAYMCPCGWRMSADQGQTSYASTKVAEMKKEEEGAGSAGASPGPAALGKCANCRFWTEMNDDWNYEDIRFDRDAELERIPGSTYAKECKNPKLLFYQRPAKDGACVVDGSQYRAALLTGPEFGCIAFEAAIAAPNPSSGEGPSPSTPDRTPDVTHPHPGEARP